MGSCFSTSPHPSPLRERSTHSRTRRAYPYEPREPSDVAPRSLHRQNFSNSRTQIPSYPANMYELVIRVSKQLEQRLETQFGATGRGLHERTTSVETELPPALVKKLRFLATVRNKVAHGSTAESPESNRDAFIKNYEQVVTELNILRSRQQIP